MGFNPLKLTTDTNKETKGVWVDLKAADGSNVRLLIARLGNPAYAARHAELMKPVRAMTRVPGVDLSAATTDITRRALADTILLGWENVTEDVDGAEVPVPYSKDKAYEFLGIRDFADMVVSLAMDSERYRQDAVEETTKN